MNIERALYERSLADPAGWCRAILRDRPWDKQAEIMDAVRTERMVAVKTSNGAGKSWIGSRILLWFGTVYPGSMILTTATKLEQVKKILWREVHLAEAKANPPLGGTILGTELRWSHGSIAFGLTAPEHDETKMQGFRASKMLIIVDEAAGVAQPIMDGVLSMMTGEGAKLLLIGNPTDPTSQFARAFKPESGYRKISISAFDTPNFTVFGIVEDDLRTGAWLEKVCARPLPAPYLVTPQWAQDRYHDWGPNDPRYQARVLARFPEESEDTLIPMHWIERARLRGEDPPAHFAQEPCELGIDVARFGGDKSAIAWRAGAFVRIHWSSDGQDTMQLTGECVLARRRTGASMHKVDEIGVGAGVVDRLKERGEPVVGVNVGSKAKDTEQFANARAEYFWGLRERFEKNEIGLVPDENGQHDDRLATELNAIRWKINSRGQVQIEAKEDIVKRLGHSPDFAEAVMLAFAPVAPRTIVFI